MGIYILIFIAGIFFAMACNEAAKALGRKMAKLEEFVP